MNIFKLTVALLMLALLTPLASAHHSWAAIFDVDSDAVFMNHLLLPDETELIFLRNAEPRWDGKSIGTSDTLAGKVVEEDFSKRPTSIFAVWNTIYGAEGSHRALQSDDDWIDHALAFQKSQEEASTAGPSDRYDCSPREILEAMGALYPIEIIDQGDTIAINAEFFDTHRTVHITSATDTPTIPKGGLRYSHGHWAWGHLGSRNYVVS